MSNMLVNFTALLPPVRFFTGINPSQYTLRIRPWSSCLAPAPLTIRGSLSGLFSIAQDQNLSFFSVVPFVLPSKYILFSVILLCHKIPSNSTTICHKIPIAFFYIITLFRNNLTHFSQNFQIDFVIPKKTPSQNLQGCFFLMGSFLPWEAFLPWKAFLPWEAFLP